MPSAPRVATVVAFLLALFTSATPVLRPRQAAAFPSPEPCTGNCTFIHDPNVVIRDDGTYFRFSTSGNIAIASAPALTGPWTYQGSLLGPGGSVDHALPKQDAWAPDCYNNAGTYICHYALSTLGSQDSDIAYATSSTMEVGSWTDQGSAGLPKNSDYNLIDPNTFQQTASGPHLFNFGSAWQGIFQTQLDGALQDFAGSLAITNVVFNSTVPPGQTIPAIAEGSFEFWWPVNGVDYYYLFFSSGACCNKPPNLAAPGDEYKIMVCRSTNAAGPFTDQAGRDCLTGNGGTLVLGSHDNIYAPGGQGVLFDSGSQRTVVYYHYVDTNVGYNNDQFLFGFNYLDFSSGWPVITT